MTSIGASDPSNPNLLYNLMCLHEIRVLASYTRLSLHLFSTTTTWNSILLQLQSYFLHLLTEKLRVYKLIKTKFSKMKLLFLTIQISRQIFLLWCTCRPISSVNTRNFHLFLNTICEECGSTVIFFQPVFYHGHYSTYHS
jgi:hypothetical protein